MGLFDFVRETVDQFRYPDQYPEAWSKKKTKKTKSDSYLFKKESMTMVFFGEWFKDCGIRRGLDDIIEDALVHHSLYNINRIVIKFDMVEEGLVVMRYRDTHHGNIKGKKVIRMKGSSEQEYLSKVLIEGLKVIVNDINFNSNLNNQ